MRKTIFLALALTGGCAARGVDDGALPGRWALSAPAGSAQYTFATDARLSFDGAAASAGSPRVQFQGAWFADASNLTISVDGGPTVTVPYLVEGDKLSIVDDPATVRAGSHETAIYFRQ